MIRGTPITNSQVSLIDNENIATNLFTDDSGMVTYNLNPNQTGNIILTVTKLDHKPYQSTISIQESSANVNFDTSHNIIISDGNDGIAAYAGEKYDFINSSKKLWCSNINKFDCGSFIKFK